MKKHLIFLLILCLAAALMTSGAVAEEAPDPFDAMMAEFASAVKVDPYPVSVQPTRVSGWAPLCWVPAKGSPFMAVCAAKQELTVLKETENWLLAENKQTGDIGYMQKAFVTKELPADGAQQEFRFTTESNGKVNLGVIDVNGAFSLQVGLPEGYTLQPVRSSHGQLVVLMTSEDPAKPEMMLTAAYDEAYASVARMNDMDDEALAALEKTFTDIDPTMEFSYGDTGLGTRLLMATESGSGTAYLNFLTVYRGYLVEFLMTASQAAADKALTEEQIAMGVELLTDLDFVPVDGAAADASLVADGLYPANLFGYDAEIGTLHVEILHSLTLDPAAAEALKPGDTLTVGQFSEVIETLEKTEDGDLLINEYITLRNYGGSVHVFLGAEEYTEPMIELVLPLPGNVRFCDWVDPETGEMCDQAAERTAEELTAMLAADPASFASGNVWVAFDENGIIVEVNRFPSSVQ